MKSIISVATSILLATTIAASAQAIGPIGGFSSGVTSGSFGAGMMSGAGAVVNGIDVQVTADSGSRIGPKSDPFAARDGRTNIPNQAHSSADCSRIITWDSSWVLPDKSVNDMTGAEKNMLRNWRILTGRPLPERYR